MVKAVLFDLDGTLANTLEDLANTGNTIVSALGVQPYETEAYKLFVGHGIPNLIERIVPKEMHTKELLDSCFVHFMEHYRAHYLDKTDVYDGMPMLVSELRKKGIKTAVVSNKIQEMTERIVQKLYGNSFDLVLGKRQELPAKPDPAMLFYACRELGVEPDSCAFVGDSGMDMAAANAASMRAVGVLWGFRSREELEKNGSQYLARDAQELLNCLTDI